jgi:hypothetical protein
MTYNNSTWNTLGGIRAVYTGNGTTTYGELGIYLNNNSTDAEKVVRVARNASTGNGILQMMNNTTAVGAAIEEFSIDGTLAGNSDLAVPTEKAVKTYVDGWHLYGEMFQQNNSTATTIASADWIQVVNFNTGLVNGFTYGASSLTAGTTGIYMVNVSFSGTQGNNGDILEFSVAVNGSAGTYSPQVKLYSLAKTNSTNVRYQGAMSGLLSLTAADVLRLIVRNTAANRNTTVTQANVSIHRVA